MSENAKPSLLDRIKNLFSRVSFSSDDESDELGTRAMNRARKQQRRRDEFVTKRELDVLRKVRRERDTPLPIRSKPNLVQPQAGAGGPNAAGSAKEDTLRKINEIERMMSVDIKGNTKKEIDAQKEAQNRAFLPTQPMSATTQRPVVLSQGAQQHVGSPELTEAQRIANSFAKTDMMTRPMTRPGMPNSSRRGGDSMAPTELMSQAGGGDNFLNSMMMSSTKMMALDVQELSDDPLLEEASIHFANGEFADAEATLLNAIAPNAPGYQHVEAWRALLDFYRATGEQGKFESLGLDFVSLFDTSAPNWFSLSGDAVSKPASASAGPAAYVCPARIDAFVANQLLQFIEMRLVGGGVVAIDCSKLKTIEPESTDGLARALQSLNETSCKVSVTEPARFTDNCAALTVANDKTVPAKAWSVRLEWLRLMGNATEFETVALDYCVANEVSPPSWVPSKAAFSVRTDTPGAAGAVAMDPLNWSLATLSVPSPVAQDGHQQAKLDHAELQGEITAGSVVVTPEMATAAGQQHLVAIDCAKLKRIDFASAGNLLNWVLEQVGVGKQVQFINAHRLIAAFFNVIGISAHARVSLRRD